MIWILANRGVSTKQRLAPFTETVIEGVHSVVYEPGVDLEPLPGTDASAGNRGTFAQGLHHISGYVFSFHGSAAETLLTVVDEIDLLIRYRANGQKRKRTLADIVFVGDATVTVPGLNTGVSALIGVPFRVQIPEGETLTEHVIDVEET